MRTENVLYAPTVFKIPHCESRGFLYNEGEGGLILVIMVETKQSIKD